MNGEPFEVYWVAEGQPDSEGVVRYSGDPDEYTALAWWWIASQRMPRDMPVVVAPPRPEWFRWVPGGEYGRTLYPARPGRGAWLGSEIRSVPAGCGECQLMGGRHTGGCLNAGLAGLVTLQFHGAGRPAPLTDSWIHAVRRRPASKRFTQDDTPGPTLCGIDRFGPNTPTWTVGGGIYEHGAAYRGCYLCGKVARREFPGLAITGTRPLATAFVATCRVPLAPHLDHDGAWRAQLAAEHRMAEHRMGVPDVDGMCV